jgi:hypothetical protein
MVEMSDSSDYDDGATLPPQLAEGDEDENRFVGAGTPRFIDDELSPEELKARFGLEPGWDKDDEETE